MSVDAFFELELYLYMLFRVEVFSVCSAGSRIDRRFVILTLYFLHLCLMTQEVLKKDAKDAAINVTATGGNEIVSQGQTASDALPTSPATSAPSSVKAYLTDIIGDKYVLKFGLYTKILKTNSCSLIVPISMQALG